MVREMMTGLISGITIVKKMASSLQPSILAASSNSSGRLTMCTELKKMGADIEELPDGLVIRESKLKGCSVNGHYDHRVVMSLAVAGLNTEGITSIDTAEAINVTFPEFTGLMKSCGADMELVD